MSYKDGIPLLSTLEDDTDEEIIGINTQLEKHCCKCGRRYICFGFSLLLVVVVIVFAVGMTLGLTLKKENAINSHPSDGGHKTGQTTSHIVFSLMESMEELASSSMMEEEINSSVTPTLNTISTGMASVNTITGMPVTPTLNTISTGMASVNAITGMPVTPTLNTISTGMASVNAITGMPVTPTLNTISTGMASVNIITSMPVTPTLNTISTGMASVNAITGMPVTPTLNTISTGMASVNAITSMPVTPTLNTISTGMASVNAITSMPVTPTLNTISPGMASVNIITSMPVTPTSNTISTGMASVNAITSMPVTPSRTISITSPVVTSTILSSSSLSLLPTSTPLPPASCKNDSAICPSTRDDRIYKFLTLESNGLRVVLISDPNTDLSGASMSVAAGSFNDPANYTGLAHFCEHMLFLGTKKYPDKNEYSKYLSTHGGYDNAYTLTQETNFHFLIQAEYLEHALDMFAHFFIDPLFSKIYTEKELNAVNQEHQKNLLLDDWRLWQLLKHVSNPNYPFSQFSTGSLETLNKTDIRDQLMQYYNESYSASTMSLVVYGRENVSVLYDMIENSFSAIAIRNTGVSPKTYNTTAFPASYLGRIILHHPQADTNILTLYWQTVSLHIYHPNAVSGFILQYLGHEGEGSIMSYLRLRALASVILANVEVDADSFYVFKLQIILTDAGLENVSDVIQTVFQFTQLLDSMTEVEFEPKWADYINISEVLFDYAEKALPNDYAADISKVMRVVQHPADFLPNPRRYISNYSLVHSVVHNLTPENCVIFIGTQNINSSSNLTLQQDLLPVQANGNKVPLPSLNFKEPIYSTPYTIYNIPEELLVYWNSSLANPELKLADPNMFVPDSTHLVLAPVSNQTVPQQLNSETTVETWVFPDTKSFYEPKVNLVCELKTANAEKTAYWEALSRVYLGVVSTKLNPILYSANVVGYTASVTNTPRGVQLSLGGFSDQDIILRLINTTIRTLLNEDDILDDEITFSMTISDIRNKLLNFNYTTSPYLYTYYYLQSLLLERPYWTNEEILQNLEDLDLGTILEFGNSLLFGNVSVVCLVHGNTNETTANSYIELIADLLSECIDTNAQVDEGFFWKRVLLGRGMDYGLSLKVFNDADQNSVVNVLFQAQSVCEVCEVEKDACSQDSLLTGLHLSLLNLVIADACFTQLRTQEGLGYIVFCLTTVRERIGSFQVVVQSEQFTPAHVLQSINSFLDNFYNTTVLSDEFELNFNDTIEVLRKSLSQKDLNLSDKTSRMWLEVMSHHHQFDLRYQQLDMLSSLNVKNFQDFYNELILDNVRRRKLLIVVYGQDKEIKVDELDVNCPVSYDQLDQTEASLGCT